MTDTRQNTRSEDCGRGTVEKGLIDGSIPRRRFLGTAGGLIVGAAGLSPTAAATTQDPAEQELVSPITKEWEQTIEGTVSEFLGWSGTHVVAVLGEKNQRQAVSLNVVNREPERIGSRGIDGGGKVAAGRAVLSNENVVTAYSVEDGSRDWSWRTERDLVRPISIQGERVLVCEADVSGGDIDPDNLVGLRDGNVDFQVRTSWVPWARELPDGSVIYLTGEAAYNKGDISPRGGQIVRYAPQQSETQWETYEVGATSAHLLSEGVIAVGEASLTLFDIATGKQRRRTEFAAPVTDILNDSERLCIALESGDLVVVRRQDWRTLWDRTFEDDVELLGATSEQLILWAGGKVSGLNTTDGSIRWEQEIGGSAPTDLLLGDGRVFAGQENSVTAYIDRRIAAENAIRTARRPSSSLDELSDSMGRIVGRDDLLSRAEKAYERGEYERALRLTDRANRREDMAVAGGGLLGLSSVFAGLRGRSRLSMRKAKSRKQSLDEHYPLQEGALAGLDPASTREALQRQVDEMHAQRGTIKIRLPQDRLPEPLAESANSLIQNHDRVVTVSEQLAGLPEGDPFRSSWSEAFEDQFSQREPTIDPVLDQFEEVFPKYRRAVSLISNTEPPEPLERITQEILRLNTTVMGTGRDSPPAAVEALDHCLEAVASLHSNWEQLQRYETEPLVEAVERWITEFEPADTESTGHDCKAVTQVADAVATVELRLAQATGTNARMLDLKHVRGCVQDTIDDVDADAAQLLSQHIDAVVTRSWPPALVADLPVEQLAFVTYEILSGSEYSLREIISLSDSVYGMTDDTGGVVVVVGEGDRMDLNEEPLRSLLEEAQKVVLVGSTESLEDAVSGGLSGETSVEAIDDSEISRRLEESALDPQLPH